MKKTAIDTSSFVGTWFCLGTSILIFENWISLRKMPEDGYVWYFRGDGMMTAVLNGKIDFTVEYRFESESMMLRLEGREKADEGEVEVETDLEFRVEFISSSEIYLYFQDSMVKNGGTEVSRMRFKKSDLF